MTPTHHLTATQFKGGGQSTLVVLDMCVKFLELYDSHCSFSSNFTNRQIWLDGRLIISRLPKGIERLNIA